MTASFTSPLALAGEGAGGACPRAGRMIDCPLRPQVISGPECDVGLCPALAARPAAPRRRLVEREARGCEPLPCRPQRDLQIAGRCATRPTLPVHFASRTHRHLRVDSIAAPVLDDTGRGPQLGTKRGAVKQDDRPL